MLLKQEGKNTISVEMTSVFQHFRESLALIRQFLSTRLAERDEQGRASAYTDLVIDVGFLSTLDNTDDIPESWRDKAVYPIRVYFSTILLGPVYRVQQSGPCPRCLERRWVANRNRDERLAYQRAQRVLAPESYPKLHPAALDALWSVIEWDLYDGSPLPLHENETGWFYSLHLDSLQVQRYQLRADSSCPICAHPELDKADPTAFQLFARPKQDITNYRLVEPRDYTLAEESYINPVCGMLGLGARQELLHTVTAPVAGAYGLTEGPTLTAIGWGGHTTQFHTSRRVGMLEGLERYCGQYPRTKKSNIIDSYRNLSPDALDPSTCGLYHPDLYASTRGLEPFNPEQLYTWVWGYSFRQARPVLVPEQLAYYFSQLDKGKHFVIDTSNGCAIGSCLEEAVLHGLLELVERDNFLIHWYAKLAAPRIDPWSSHNVRTLRLLDRLKRLNYDLYFLDTRLDLPFPTVTGIAIRRDDNLGKLALAAGASLDPEKALLAALCELAAYIPNLSERVEADLETLRGLVQDPTKIKTIEQHTLLYGLPEVAGYASFLLQNPALHSLEETYKEWSVRQPRNRDLRADLQYNIERIVEVGMDVIVVDQTAPELNGTDLKVVRVIIPGLVPIDFGWGRHRVFNLPRMRTVPRTAGYSDTDFDLSMLNLTPHPFP